MAMEARVFNSKSKEEKDLVLKYVKPTQSLLAKGDFVYREYFSKAIRAGIMTSAEAHKMLKDREIWNETHEEKLLDMKVLLLALEEQLPALDKEKGQAVYDQIKKLRNDIDELVAIRKNITDNTAEAVAADMRTQFFASECVVYNDSGKRVFKDLKDFLERLDEPSAVDSYRQALIANYEQMLGIKMSDKLEVPVLPEDKWLADKVEALKAEIEAATPTEMKEEEVAPPKKKGRKAAVSS